MCSGYGSSGRLRYDLCRLPHGLALASAGGLSGQILVDRGPDRYGRCLARGAWRIVSNLLDAGRTRDGQRSAVGRAVLRAVLRSVTPGPAAPRSRPVARVAAAAARDATRAGAVGATSRGAGEIARPSCHAASRAEHPGGVAARPAVHDDARDRPVHVRVDGPAPTRLPPHVGSDRALARPRRGGWTLARSRCDRRPPAGPRLWSQPRPHGRHGDADPRAGRVEDAVARVAVGEVIRLVDLGEAVGDLGARQVDLPERPAQAAIPIGEQRGIEVLAVGLLTEADVDGDPRVGGTLQ